MKPRQYFNDLIDIIQSIKVEQMPLIYGVGSIKEDWEEEIKVIRRLNDEFEDFESIQGELVAEKYRKDVVNCLDKLDWIQRNLGKPQHIKPILTSVQLLLFRWQTFLKINKNDFPKDVTKKYQPIFNELVNKNIIKGDYEDFVAFMEKHEPNNKLAFVLQSPKKNGISKIALLELIVLAGYDFSSEQKHCTRLTNEISKKYFGKEIDSSVWQRPQSANYEMLKEIFESTK
jgi:hypothetical protein